MKLKLILVLLFATFLVGCLGPARTVSLPMTVIRKDELTLPNQNKKCAVEFEWEHSDGWGNRYDTTEYKEQYCKYNVGDIIQ